MTCYTSYDLWVVITKNAESADIIYTSKNDAETYLNGLPKKYHKLYSVMSLDAAIDEFKSNYEISYSSSQDPDY